MAGTTSTKTPSPSSSSSKRKKTGNNNNKKFSKTPITKEERRAKYTQLARDRETKRRKRQATSHLVCYQCRQKGHAVADCPQNSKSNDPKRNSKQPASSAASAATTICYKCGSTEHPLSKCPKRNDGDVDDLPYCHCFICNQMGHLSSKCPQNTHGIFVNGGQCKTCGSKYHTSKNCPERQDATKKKDKQVTEKELPEIDEAELLQGQGDDIMPSSTSKDANANQKKDETEKSNNKKKAKPSRRVVNF